MRIATAPISERINEPVSCSKYWMIATGMIRIKVTTQIVTADLL